MSLSEWYNIKKSAHLLYLSLTLSTVISSSASAVVSSSSVLACCSWFSTAWRAACRLLIWDSRSCSDRVTSVTWRLISSFCSSCSSPIYKGRQKGGMRDQGGWRRWITPRSCRRHADMTQPPTGMRAGITSDTSPCLTPQQFLVLHFAVTSEFSLFNSTKLLSRICTEFIKLLIDSSDSKSVRNSRLFRTIFAHFKTKILYRTCISHLYTVRQMCFTFFSIKSSRSIL